MHAYKKKSRVACIIFLLEFMDSSTPLNPTALKPTQAENSGLSLILWPESFLGGLTDSLLTSAASSSSLTSPSSVLLRLPESFFPYRKKEKCLIVIVILGVWFIPFYCYVKCQPRQFLLLLLYNIITKSKDVEQEHM